MPLVEVDKRCLYLHFACSRVESGASGHTVELPGDRRRVLRSMFQLVPAAGAEQGAPRAW